jgi:hypothetical protein
MKLSKLLVVLPNKELRGRVVLSLSKGIGDLFVAIKGLDADGHILSPKRSGRERWPSSVSGLSLSPCPDWMPFRRGQDWAVS